MAAVQPLDRAGLRVVAARDDGIDRLTGMIDVITIRIR